MNIRNWKFGIYIFFKFKKLAILCWAFNHSVSMLLSLSCCFLVNKVVLAIWILEVPCSLESIYLKYSDPLYVLLGCMSKWLNMSGRDTNPWPFGSRQDLVSTGTAIESVYLGCQSLVRMQWSTLCFRSPFLLMNFPVYFTTLSRPYLGRISADGQGKLSLDYHIRFLFRTLY